jgi:hypothetical protein
MVDIEHISSASGTAVLDPDHLIFEYATSDSEDLATVQLPTQASVGVLYICRFEECLFKL